MMKLKILPYVVLGLLLPTLNSQASDRPMTRKSPSTHTSVDKSDKTPKAKPITPGLSDSIQELGQTMANMNSNISDVQIAQDVNFSISAVQGANFKVSF